MSGYELIVQLTSIIRLLTEYPQGLSMLLGRIPAPTCEIINDILATVRPVCDQTLDLAGMPLRVDGSGKASFENDRRIDNEEHWNQVIDRSGGWDHITAVVRWWRGKYSNSWAIVVEYRRLTKSRVDDVSYRTIADDLNISRDTVYKTILEFPQRLAVAIINTPVGEVLESEVV